MSLRGNSDAYLNSIRRYEHEHFMAQKADLNRSPKTKYDFCVGLSAESLRY
jgi:hypothetical protein